MKVEVWRFADFLHRSFPVFNRDIITATCAISCFATALFGLVTNMPVALAYV